MALIKSIIILIIGFALLMKGADYFVEGSSSLAQILKVPSVVIGLTIVAMGTSAPEASVSINAALAEPGGSSDTEYHSRQSRDRDRKTGRNALSAGAVYGISCGRFVQSIPVFPFLKGERPCG